MAEYLGSTGWLLEKAAWKAEAERRGEELEQLKAEVAGLRAERDLLADSYAEMGTLALAAAAERDQLIEACVYEFRYRLHPRGEEKRGWRWMVGERSGIEDSPEAARAAVRTAAGLDVAGSAKPRLSDTIAAVRAAGGSDWDKIADVEVYLGRKDEDDQAAPSGPGGGP